MKKYLVNLLMVVSIASSAAYALPGDIVPNGRLLGSDFDGVPLPPKAEFTKDVVCNAQGCVADTRPEVVREYKMPCSFFDRMQNDFVKSAAVKNYDLDTVTVSEVLPIAEGMRLNSRCVGISLATGELVEYIALGYTEGGQPIDSQCTDPPHCEVGATYMIATKHGRALGSINISKQLEGDCEVTK